MAHQIKVTVKPLAHQESISLKDGCYHIDVKEAPEHNKANKAVLKLIKKHFKKHARIAHGLTSREKIIELF